MSQSSTDNNDTPLDTTQLNLQQKTNIIKKNKNKEITNKLTNDANKTK